jgi:hypothetical protein
MLSSDICANLWFVRNQCCGAGAARKRIILMEPEPKRDAAPALKKMFNMGSFQKPTQTK